MEGSGGWQLDWRPNRAPVNTRDGHLSDTCHRLLPFNLQLSTPLSFQRSTRYLTYLVVFLEIIYHRSLHSGVFECSMQPSE